MRPGARFSSATWHRREDREALIRFARERFASLDLLVNNAGMAPRERRDILEATEESFDELMAANLKGPYFLTQQAARWMAERGEGRIVFVTSISAYTASVNRGEYCISKAGLSMSVALYAQRLAETRGEGFRDPAGDYPHRHDRQSGKGVRGEDRREDYCRSAAWAKAATWRRP